MLSFIAAGPDNSLKMRLQYVLVASPVSGSTAGQGDAEEEEDDHCGYFHHSCHSCLLSVLVKLREENELQSRGEGRIYVRRGAGTEPPGSRVK